MATEATIGNRQYEIGRFIDSKDTMNQWCVALVTSFDPERKQVSVRYDGWSEKWDATFSVSSSKVAPFRSKSWLYTGQKKSAIRDWSFSEQEIQEVESKVRQMMDSLSTGDAFETT